MYFSTVVVHVVLAVALVVIAVDFAVVDGVGVGIRWAAQALNTSPPCPFRYKKTSTPRSVQGSS